MEPIKYLFFHRTNHRYWYIVHYHTGNWIDRMNHLAVYQFSRDIYLLPHPIHLYFHILLIIFKFYCWNVLKIPAQSRTRLHSEFPDTHAPYMHRKAYRGHSVAIQFSVVSSLPSLFVSMKIKNESQFLIRKINYSKIFLWHLPTVSITITCFRWINTLTIIALPFICSTLCCWNRISISIRNRCRCYKYISKEKPN